MLRWCQKGQVVQVFVLVSTPVLMIDFFAKLQCNHFAEPSMLLGMLTGKPVGAIKDFTAANLH